MIRDLNGDHEELRARMRRYAVLMHGDPAEVAPELYRERVAFSLAFHRHRRDEADALLQAERARPDVAEVVRSVLQADALLDADYSAHVNRWTPQQILADWGGYRRDVLALQARLKLRLAQEERLLHPLLAAAAD